MAAAVDNYEVLVPRSVGILLGLNFQVLYGQPAERSAQRHSFAGDDRGGKLRREGVESPLEVGGRIGDAGSNENLVILKLEVKVEGKEGKP